MSDTGGPTSDLIRELYARFGLAYYMSECLHRGLCIYLAGATFEKLAHITQPRADEKFTHAFSLTFALAVQELQGVLPDDLIGELDAAAEKRNFLAHRFWFERAHLMFSPAGIRQMIQELDELSDEFQRLDEKVEALYHPKRRELGLSDDLVQAALQECMAGKPWQPFPRRRRLRKQERLVRVWEFTLPGGAKPLVFETEDGCLWQLCDAGLGWSYYDEVKPDWKLQEVICRHLPANVDPRPKDARPWDYQFRLARGAILWVKLGSRAKTFTWGIRTECEPTEP
jgi:hypothetical protein